MNVIQPAASTVSFALQCVAHHVAPDPLINARAQHSILKAVPQAIERVPVRFHKVILAQELVDGVAQAGIVKVSRKSLRMAPRRFQTDTDQRDAPLGAARFQKSGRARGAAPAV